MSNSSTNGHGPSRPAPGARRADPLFAGVGAVCDTAVRLTGVDGAAVAVLTRTSQIRELVYATDALAQQIDELQFTLGEGPCIDAYLNNHPQHHPRLDDDSPGTRWPLFNTDVVALGVQALFAFPVPGRERPMAVLELYRRTSGDLTAIEKNSAVVCAVAVTRTLQGNWDIHAAAHPDAGAQETIDAAAEMAAAAGSPIDPFTRSQVYVAAGMVAVQLAVTPEQGLDRLRAYAYSHGRPISDVSTEIVDRRLSLRDQRDTAKDM